MQHFASLLALPALSYELARDIIRFKSLEWAVKLTHHTPTHSQSRTRTLPPTQLHTHTHTPAHSHPHTSTSTHQWRAQRGDVRRRVNVYARVWVCVFVRLKCNLYPSNKVQVWTLDPIYTCNVMHINFRVYIYYALWFRRREVVCIHTYIHTCIYAYNSRCSHSIKNSMGWLRLVGSLYYRTLLQKSPIKEAIFCKNEVWF